jgi:hypothetical protein
MNTNTSVSVTSNQTSGINKSKRTVKFQMPMQTTDSFSLNTSYRMKLPSNIDVLSKLSEAVVSLSNADVKKHTFDVLNMLNSSLREINNYSNLSNYLSRINVIEQIDSAALIEWSFQNFRVGFSIEPDMNESSYFIVSEDKSTGSFIADTKKVGSEIDAAIEKIVEYVIRNT